LMEVDSVCDGAVPVHVNVELAPMLHVPDT